MMTATTMLMVGGGNNSHGGSGMNLFLLQEQRVVGNEYVWGKNKGAPPLQSIKKSVLDGFAPFDPSSWWGIPPT